MRVLPVEAPRAEAEKEPVVDVPAIDMTISGRAAADISSGGAANPR